MAWSWAKQKAHFERHVAVYWANLSRLTSLLIILNVSLFFLTEKVTQGYFYTYFSLLCLFLIYLAMILPLGHIHRLGLYWICLGLLLIALYFLVTSVWYWIEHSGEMAVPFFPR